MPSGVSEGHPRTQRGPNVAQLAWLAPLAAVLVALRLPTQDNSYLWHIEAGLRQLAGGTALTEDPFSFTAGGEPWRTQSWLMELMYGWFEAIDPLSSANVVVAISAIVLLGAVALRLGTTRGIIGPLGVLWVMWLTLGYFTARPVFASLALFALITLAADFRRLAWTVPLIFWLWASIHGGFIVGIGYLVLQGLRLGEKAYFRDAAAAAVAASLTAHGAGVWETLLAFAQSSGNLELIVEWRPPDFISLGLAPFALGIVALIILATFQKVDRRDLFVVVPFVLFALTANRAVPLAAIALVTFVFPPTTWKIGTAPLAGPAAYPVILAVIVIPFLVPVDEGAFATRFPVSAARHLESVRTFHDDSAGGYLIYQGFPFIFVDDRAELYGDVYEDFVETRAAKPGWQRVFEEYGLRQALVTPEDPLYAALLLDEWSVEYEDEEFAVLRP